VPDGRRNNGGHSTKGKAGRKPKTDEEKKLELISASIPTSEIIELCAKQARKGNMKAIELLLYYVIGKPKEQKSLDVNFLDVKPIEWVDEA